jgi:hypothetical protein
MNFDKWGLNILLCWAEPYSALLMEMRIHVEKAELRARGLRDVGRDGARLGHLQDVASAILDFAIAACHMLFYLCPSP